MKVGSLGLMVAAPGFCPPPEVSFVSGFDDYLAEAYQDCSLSKGMLQPSSFWGSALASCDS